MSGIRVGDTWKDRKDASQKALGKVESWPDDLLSSEFYQARFKKKNCRAWDANKYKAKM